MKTYKTHLALAIIVGASFLGTGPFIRASESDGHSHSHHDAEPSVAVLVSASDILEKAQGLHREIAILVKARDLGPVHELAEQLSETVGMLPALSTDLPESNRRRIKGTVKNLARALDKIHDAADEGDQAVTEKQLRVVGSLLKVVAAQYPKSDDDGHSGHHS